MEDPDKLLKATSRLVLKDSQRFFSGFSVSACLAGGQHSYMYTAYVLKYSDSTAQHRIGFELFYPHACRALASPTFLVTFESKTFGVQMMLVSMPLFTRNVN